MAYHKIGELFVNEDNQFNSYVQGPIAGTKGGEDGSDCLVRAIINRFARDSNGIAECLRSSLELDADAYSIYVSGTPVSITGLDGTSIGYSIHLSIYKSLEPRKPKTVRRVGSPPRGKH